MSRDKQTDERYEIADIISDSFDHNGEKWDASDFEWSAHCVQMAGYRKASAIFEEIEEEIKLALVSNHKAKRDHMEKHYYCLHAEFLSAVQGKIDALRGIEAFIAELKKKYKSET